MTTTPRSQGQLGPSRRESATSMRRRLPVQLQLVSGEALDSYLERLAAANLLDHPGLLEALSSPPVAFWMLAPQHRLLKACAQVAGVDQRQLEQATMRGLVGIDVAGLDPDDLTTWRIVASQGWAPNHGSQVCPVCLATDGAWRITWRHPWVATCLEHGSWLHARCPSCGRPFRSQRHSPLQTVDAIPGRCGNPAGARGRTCQQNLTTLPHTPAPAGVLRTQRTIDRAIHAEPVELLGKHVAAAAYLSELKALTVLLLHLACEPGAADLATWADAAIVDRARSAAGRGARWGLAPPQDPTLRGHALATADAILSLEPDDAARALSEWVELVPPTVEGRLGWLADRTTMTPQLTCLMMAAASTRVRLATYLARQASLPRAVIPQVLPTDLYQRCLGTHLAVTDQAGRLFASLCLARRGQRRGTWASAAQRLGLPADLGTKNARNCTANLLSRVYVFAEALSQAAASIDPQTDYAQREQAVQTLASGSGAAAVRRAILAGARAEASTESRAGSRDLSDWWLTVRRTTGSRASSRRYAIAWLWTTYACGHLSTSPGWDGPPSARDRAYYRRFITRLSPAAQRSLTHHATEQVLILPCNRSNAT